MVMRRTDLSLLQSLTSLRQRQARSGKMSEVVAMAGQAYMRQLQAHPLRTKAITSGVLVGCSDAVAQKISSVIKLQLRRLLLIAVSFSFSDPCGNQLFPAIVVSFSV
jgi:hypothetical protein